MSPLAGDPQPVLADRLSIVLKRKLDAENDLKAYDWAVLDFRTGEVVWEKLVGTGGRFENWWLPPIIGPNGALYSTVYGGLTMMKDAPQPTIQGLVSLRKSAGNTAKVTKE